MHVIAWILALPLLFYLIFPAILWLIRKFQHPPSNLDAASLKHFTCIITAYKDFTMCPMLIDSLRRTQYKAMEIIVIADQCKPAKPVPTELAEVIEPESPLNSKLKSVELAVGHASSLSDGFVIFDPDNLVSGNFFQELNRYASQYKIIQGIRIAKNQENTTARADALGEYYHNYSERLIPFLAGASPTFSGSGMYIDKQLLRDFLNSGKYQAIEEKKVLLGEDKLMHNHFVKHGHRIAFSTEAIVYDEKVSSHTQAKTQRGRWIRAYFENIPRAIKLTLLGLSKLNFNQVVSGLISLKPPLVPFFMAITLLALICVKIYPIISLALVAGVVIFTLYFIYASFSSPHAQHVGRSFMAIPRFAFIQFLSLFSRGRHKTFEVTKQHHPISIDDIENT